MAAPLQIDLNAVRRQMKAQLAALAAEVDRTRADAGFQEALRTMAAFWNYSPVNQFLIRIQCPEAVRVAGRKTWAHLGRKVREGERPLLVFAPTTWGHGFVEVPVFDVRQTEGAPLPTLETDLTGDSQHVATLAQAGERLGVEVLFRVQEDGLGGTSNGGRVEVDPRSPTAQQVRVLAHELAHEVLHQQERAKVASALRAPPRRSHAEVETEADATAYVVLLALGLEAPSPAYIAWRGGDGAQVLRSMTRVQRAATRILGAVRDAAASKRSRSRGADPRRSAGCTPSRPEGDQQCGVAGIDGSEYH